MEIALTLWQLTGIVIAAVVGITTLISIMIAAGIRIGNFVTRDDLDRTSDKLEKQIGDEVGRLEKQLATKLDAWKRKSTIATRRCCSPSKTSAPASKTPF